MSLYPVDFLDLCGIHCDGLAVFFERSLIRKLKFNQAILGCP